MGHDFDLLTGFCCRCGCSVMSVLEGQNVRCFEGNVTSVVPILARRRLALLVGTALDGPGIA